MLLANCLMGSVDIAMFVLSNQLTNDVVIWSNDVPGFVDDFGMLAVTMLDGCSDFDATQLTLCPSHESFFHYLTFDIRRPPT